MGSSSSSDDFSKMNEYHLNDSRNDWIKFGYFAGGFVFLSVEVIVSCIGFTSLLGYTTALILCLVTALLALIFLCICFYYVNFKYGTPLTNIIVNNQQKPQAQFSSAPAFYGASASQPPPPRPVYQPQYQPELYQPQQYPQQQQQQQQYLPQGRFFARIALVIGIILTLILLILSIYTMLPISVGFFFWIALFGVFAAVGAFIFFVFFARKGIPAAVDSSMTGTSANSSMANSNPCPPAPDCAVAPSLQYAQPPPLPPRPNNDISMFGS